MLTSRVPVFNMSLGKILKDAVDVSCEVPGIQYATGAEFRMTLRFENSAEGFRMEQALQEYHAANNQKLGYNRCFCCQTGNLSIIYEDFSNSQQYKPKIVVNNYLQNFVSLLLCLFQRRRILLGMAEIKPQHDSTIYFPMIMAAEFVDAPSYGPIALSLDHIFMSLQTGLQSMNMTDPQNTDYMLLLRYKEVLNLPYCYERVEALWRIIEALGAMITDTAASDAEYLRLKIVVGAKKESGILKNIAKAAVTYGISCSDQEILDSFLYRHRTIHEYLNIDVVNEAKLVTIFPFLTKTVERIILSKLHIPLADYIEPAYGMSQYRVL